jgi:hypothetical protein
MKSKVIRIKGEAMSEENENKDVSIVNYTKRHSAMDETFFRFVVIMLLLVIALCLVGIYFDNHHGILGGKSLRDVLASL